MRNSVFLVLISVFLQYVRTGDNDFNQVNRDGSFKFELSNNDIGSHSHSATGTINGVIRGRYASRNPETGRVDETVYTAGPRGFRARGPNIHRKMDLSQVPRGPIGSKDDPLSDPFDDPSYAFQFKSQDYNRREDQDSTGRVRGLYSFIDDVGEKHIVRYAAGAGTGYEVYNTIPDSVFNVRYNSPLYKSNRKSRGRIAYERGPSGQYRFVSSAPDQRRSESIGSDGITRGSYSFLDDKGVQRTIEYMAGAGIGYRVVKTTIGPLSHVLPAPVVPEFGLRGPLSNEIAASDARNRNIDDSNLNTAESGRSFKNRGENSENNKQDDYNHDDEDGVMENKDFNTTKPDYGRRQGPRIRPNKKTAGRQSSSEKYKPNNSNASSRNQNTDSKSPPQYLHRNRSKFPETNPTDLPEVDDNMDSIGNNINNNLTPVPRGPDIPNVIGESYDSRVPSIPFDETNIKSKDGTLIKNVGDFYVGLPPGAVVRAHVQSIDLLPYEARAPSPAEALRRESEGL